MILRLSVPDVELPGTHVGALRRNAGLAVEQPGDGCAMRFPGLVLPRKNEQSAKKHEKPIKPRLPTYKSCALQSAQSAQPYILK